VFILRMCDRLTDHGLVGVAVVSGSNILNFVLSCRVIGLGGEHTLIRAVIAEATAAGRPVVGRIVPTGRNLPARNLYAAAGFIDCTDGIWAMPPPTHAALSESLEHA
jgi:predicted enzyme involved in methoxymalonyl-ACP biosynthesis